MLKLKYVIKTNESNSQQERFDFTSSNCNFMTPVYKIHDVVKIGTQNLTWDAISSYMYVRVKLDILYFQNEISLII